VDIKASEIKELREKTGAGMMDCKKALTEAKGDFAGAEKLLREWGMAGVEKRAGRATNEGKIFIKEGPGKTSAVEIVCETDFVCRNQDFIDAGNKAVAIAFDKGYTKAEPELEAIVTELAAKIKENMALKRVRLVTSGPNECLHSYVHGEATLAVVVKFRSDKPEAFKNDKVKALVHDVALHIAAFNPMFLDESKPSPTWIEEQKAIFAKQIELDEKMKGKPEKVIQGAAAGKLKKLLAETCLLNQGFVKEEKTPVSQVMASVAKEVGAKLEIVDYCYLKVGESA
jgi:translation elongation factor Ts